MKNPFFNLGRVSVLLALGGTALVAQGTQTANISGEVVDKAGNPVAGVTVRLSSSALQIPRIIVTDAKGRFVSRLLPTGTYAIELSKDGFQGFKANQAIGIGQTFEPRYVMSPVGATTVEVIATASDIDKTDIKSAQNYRLDNVDKLPNARTMEGVALLTPGVTTGVGGRVQIRGAMTSGNLYLLDGQNVSDNAYNNRGVRLIDDSIEEVQVITGAISAEYGDVDGGVMNAVTRSGGNEFHGQLRWELSNSAWNAFQPLQSRTALNNKLNEEKTLSLNGFIIKDRLWFSSSFFKTDQTNPGTITANIPVVSYLGGTYFSGNGPEGLGASYDASRKEIRRQIKLTFAVNANHTLLASFMNARIDDVNRNYSAGELRALVPQVSTSEFTTFQWRAIWSNSLTTEAKIGSKKQMLSAGGAANGQSPIYNYTNGFFYNNGIFNSADGGDNRNNKTFNAKASLFWDAMGGHQTDFGIDYYKGTQRARNDQSPTGYIFGARRMNLATRQAWGLDIWVFTSGVGEANNYSQAFYVNDKWNVDKHLSFNLGLRFDGFKAEREDGSSSAKSTGLSPRLGMKYDIQGDGKYVAGLSFARYNSKVLEGITNSVTNQGNPTEVDHPYMGAGGPQTFAYLTDLSQINARYDFSSISYYNNPTENVRLSGNLKNPTVDEIQASFMYSFDQPAIGNGFVRLTAVNKTWKKLFDYRVGNDGQVNTTVGPVYLKVWENSNIAERKYTALEFDAQLNRNNWLIVGNVTMSKLEGNYEGEGTSSPARGEGLQNFTIQDGVVMYDRALTAPYGYLQGHVPIRSRWTASYVFDNAYGKTTLGLVHRADSGRSYSITRVIDPTDLNPAISPEYGTSATQYLGGRGKGGRFSWTTSLDLAVTHDFTIFKVADRAVSGFFKLVIGNVLNHQQIATWNIQFADNNGGALTDPFVAANPAQFGKPNSNADFVAARTIAVSAGFKF